MTFAPDIRAGRKAGFPAGPVMLSRFFSGDIFRQNTAEFLLANAREFGDLVHFESLGRNVYQVNHPDLIADMFLKDAPNHHRNLVMQRARDVLGHGLLTSEEPLHMRQRRLAQPAFLRERIAAYAEVIGEKTINLMEHWKSGTITDLHPQMLELALRIVAKCLFDLDRFSTDDKGDDIAPIAVAVDSFMSFLPLSFVPFSRQIQKLPIPAMRRLQRGKAHLDELIYAVIAERRADPTDRGDLLSMLLNATDPDEAVGSGNSNKMSDQQLHDECITVILAGHETTANALSFALHLLAHHTEIQERVHEEAARVLGDRSPTSADYAQLPYATKVFAEAMRLYPPVWVTARTCEVPYEIAGYKIPKGRVCWRPSTQFTAIPATFLTPTASIRSGTRLRQRRSDRGMHTSHLRVEAGSASRRGWRGWKGRWCWLVSVGTGV
jgi:cytochrome P450